MQATKYLQLDDKIISQPKSLFYIACNCVSGRQNQASAKIMTYKVFGNVRKGNIFKLYYGERNIALSILKPKILYFETYPVIIHRKPNC